MLLVYQMPKTGSQTVEATLQRCYLPHQIFRVHYLTSALGSQFRKAMKSHRSDPSWKHLATQQLDTAEMLRRTIRRRRLLRCCGMPLPRLEVITGVRELIGLVLSSVFQNHTFFAREPSELTPELCREVLQRPAMFNWLEQWFDQELKASCGIDVYARTFPREEGYAIYENRHTRVLVYRIEALPHLPRMLREFLGCRAPDVVQRNVGTEKPYADQYMFVRERLRLPMSFVEEKYRTQMMTHFYSNRERKAFALRWSEAARASDLRESLTAHAGRDYGAGAMPSLA
jgi:hypothetical protein